MFQIRLLRHRLPDDRLLRSVAVLQLLLQLEAAGHLPIHRLRARVGRSHRVHFRLLRGTKIQTIASRYSRLGWLLALKSSIITTLFIYSRVHLLRIERYCARHALRGGQRVGEVDRRGGARLALSHGDPLHHGRCPVRGQGTGEVLSRKTGHLGKFRFSFNGIMSVMTLFSHNSPNAIFKSMFEYKLHYFRNISWIHYSNVCFLFMLQFHSHQIFHCFVMAGAFVHYHGISNMAIYRLQNGECPVEPLSQACLVQDASVLMASA